MKRTLAIAGASALLLWTGLGLVAWSRIARSATSVAGEGSSAEARGGTSREPELAALADELGALHQDVRALARTMGENLQALADELGARQDEHAAALERRVQAWRDEVGSPLTDSSSRDELADLVRELGTLRDALRSSELPAVAAQPVPSSPPLVVESAPPPAAVPDADPAAVLPAPPSTERARPRKSFLAFELPSDDLRFDERRTWTVLPSLSRVGFDARTTLHDFSATTSAVEGELEADLSRAGAAPRAHLRVQAATLASGNVERDEGMREHLAVEQHPLLEFELTSFVPLEIDAAALRASGRAHGRMSVRGVTQEVVMPVQLSIDDSRRLCVEGQMTLDLKGFGVPVPSKLGLITMEKEVEVWISLRLRANARSEG